MPSGFGKAKPCLIFIIFFPLTREGSAVKLNFSLPAGMGSPCLGFKSLDALSFYETVEIGTCRAVGACVIALLFRLSFTFSVFH